MTSAEPPKYRMRFGPAAMDVDAVHASLARSYWAEGIPKDVVAKAIANSLCVGIFYGDEQVAFARVITDRATFAYLADVFVHEDHRGKGLSKRLMEALVAHPDLQGLRRWVLVTRDAHDLYARYGFEPLGEPGARYMQRFDPDVYRRRAGLAPQPAPAAPAPPPGVPPEGRRGMGTVRLLGSIGVLLAFLLTFGIYEFATVFDGTPSPGWMVSIFLPLFGAILGMAGVIVVDVAARKARFLLASAALLAAVPGGLVFLLGSTSAGLFFMLPAYFLLGACAVVPVMAAAQ